MDSFTKDTLQQLDSAIKILCRIAESLHLTIERNAPAPTLPFPEPVPRETKKPQKDGCIVLSFPSRRADGERPTCAERSQRESTLQFSIEEISKMPKEFRKIFRTNKQTAHVRKKKSGIYEIRIQIDGCRITASARYLDLAKERFIQKLREYTENGKRRQSQALLLSYVEQWLETVKKPFIKESTYKMYLQTFNAYVKPKFPGRTLASITQFELQHFINDFVQNGKNRTAQKIALLLSAVFDYAVDDGIIERSPMKRVVVARYEQESGQSLTREEERKLLAAFRSSPDVYAQAYVFMIYTGVRRSELASVELKDGWVHVVTSKQRKGVKEKVRRLPVSPMLENVLPFIDVSAIKALSPGVLTKHVKDFLPAHHLHDLRHTFITRAQECGIKRELVSLWAGHAADSSITSTVYTHLEQNEEHQIAQMRLFSYD